jgi:hypothetical protein
MRLSLNKRFWGFLPETFLLWENLMKTIYAILFLLTISFAARAATNPQEIMEKNEQARRLSEVIAKAKLSTGGGGSQDRVKEFTWWRKLTSDGVRYSTLTRFHFPPEVKGQGILFLERPDQTDVQLYLPTFKKIRRVESQQQSGSFMGSEFSYSDISTPHVSDYSYKMVKEDEACSDGTKALSCFVIEATPANDAVKDRTGSVRSVHWIRKDNFVGARTEHYNLENQLWKKITFSDVKEVLPKDHKWMAFNVKVDNARTQKFTTLGFSDVKVDQKVPDSTFTSQNLQRE